MNQEAIWSARYRDAGEDYLLGSAPSHFLAHLQPLFQQGQHALAIADGEGRNLVWLAEHGLEVINASKPPWQRAESNQSTCRSEASFARSCASIATVPGQSPRCN